MVLAVETENLRTIPPEASVADSLVMTSDNTEDTRVLKLITGDSGKRHFVLHFSHMVMLVLFTYFFQGGVIQHFCSTGVSILTVFPYTHPLQSHYQMQ
jgi:hypothetical protein